MTRFRLTATSAVAFARPAAVDREFGTCFNATPNCAQPLANASLLRYK